MYCKPCFYTKSLWSCWLAVSIVGDITVSLQHYMFDTTSKSNMIENNVLFNKITLQKESVSFKIITLWKVFEKHNIRVQYTSNFLQ